jgi:hypothetical protein
VEITQKKPFADIDGNPYCIWCYSLLVDPPSEFTHLIGLGFPSGVDIRNPVAYPDVVEVAGTFLDTNASVGQQFVYIKLAAAPPPRTTVALCFIAPCAETAHSSVTLQTKAPNEPAWTSLQFDMGRQGVGVADLQMRGPAQTAAASSQSAHGILPYAAEEFGIYQPLVGWWSQRSQEVLANAVASRFMSAVRLLPSANNVGLNNALEAPLTPLATDRTGTSIGSQLVGSLATAQARPGTPLENQLPGLAARLAASVGQGGVGPVRDQAQASQRMMTTEHGPAIALDQEAAAVQLLHYASRTSPSLMAQMFAPALVGWEQTIGGAAWLAEDHPAKQAFLSPIGILHRFREYFFELGTFLGQPVGHVWISPGGTVELVEVNTRKTTVERTIEQTTETVQKTEQATTDRDELADAVKMENATDTRLGVTATASGSAGVFQASGSASLNLDISRKEAREQTHKRMREQSSKLSGEVRQNYKTTFRTVTETTDTSSRRYVVQNTTARLVSYELSRKMRKLAVQVQDLGLQLCWQIFVDNPGDVLGLGEFVHEAMTLTDPASKPPDEQPNPGPIPKPFSTAVNFINTRADEGHDANPDVPYTTDPDRADHGKWKPDVGVASIIQFQFEFEAPAPPPDYQLTRIDSITFRGEAAATTDGVGTPNPNPQTNHFSFRLTRAHFHNQPSIGCDVALVYTPTQAAIDKVAKANSEAKTKYNDELARQAHANFFKALRERLKMVGKVRPRLADELREEERDIVYRRIISKLFGMSDGGSKSWSDDDYHVAAELVRYLFDVDAMLYFVAADWWRPRPQPLVSLDSKGEIQPTVLVDDRSTPVLNRLRPNYPITEESAPAPQGSSLGWLIQLDGDTHRNAFLNSPWVKAVLPIRPGRERLAIGWLKRPHVEDVRGLDQPYPYDPATDPPEYEGLTVEEALLSLADKIAAENVAAMTPVPTDPNAVNSPMALPAEVVFSHGFDPLAGGIQFGAKPFKVFSEWMDILPTDQVVATEYGLTGL